MNEQLDIFGGATSGRRGRRPGICPRCGGVKKKAAALCRKCRFAVMSENKLLDKSHYHRRHRYGMEPAEYDVMLLSQGGVCFGCGKPPKGKRNSKYLHVDHDHETGAVRRLLCAVCNTHLGVLEMYGVAYDEAIELIRSAYAAAPPSRLLIRSRGRITGFAWTEGPVMVVPISELV